MLALHYLQAIKDLLMRGPFPNREDHGFAKPTLRAVPPRNAFEKRSRLGTGSRFRLGTVHTTTAASRTLPWLASGW